MCISFLSLATALVVVRPPALVVVSSPSHCRSAAPISSAVVLTREEEAKAAWLAKQDAFGGLAGVHFMLQKSGRHEIAWRSDQLAHLLDSGWHV